MSDVFMVRLMRELYPKGYNRKVFKSDYEYLSQEVYCLRDVVEKKKAKKP